MHRPRTSSPESSAWHTTTVQAPPRNAHDRPALLVAVGAGALDDPSLLHFVASILAPTTLSLAVVVPESDEPLDEALQHHAELPVVSVTSAVRPAPGRIYVAAPRKRLVLDGAQLRAVEASEAPLDALLQQIAAQRGPNAIAVVLGGSGTDGARGARAVKAAGGVVLVLPPTATSHDEMPRHALAACPADLVAPADQLGRRLITYAQLGHDAAPGSEVGPALSPEVIQAVIQTHTGYDLRPYRPAHLLPRLRRRMHLLGEVNAEAYRRRLWSEPEESVALLDAILPPIAASIGGAPIADALSEDVLAALFDGKQPGDQVRVWTVGCGSGEEAYTLALLLSDYAARLEAPPELRVYATDVRAQAIAHARRGCYTAPVLHPVDADLRSRYFYADEHAYCVRPLLRGKVVLAVHNVLTTPPFSGLDLIHCRGLVPALRTLSRERLLRLFHAALSEGGHLMLGAEETPDSLDDGFVPVGEGDSLYRRIGTDRPASLLPPLVAGPGLSAPPSAVSVGEAQPEQALHHQLIELYAPPSLLVNDRCELLHASERSLTSSLLHQVRPEVVKALRAACTEAFTHARPVESPPVHYTEGTSSFHVRLHVRPGSGLDGQRYALVLFDELSPATPPPRPSQAADRPAAPPGAMHEPDTLEATKDQLRIAMEMQEASNEELTCLADDQRATAARLQEANEQLAEVNAENERRIEEISQINSDLENLMAATQIGTLFLSRRLTLQRWTPAAEQLFDLTASDRDRPLGQLTHHLTSYPGLAADARAVLARQEQISREVRSDDGRWYLVRHRPYYRTARQIDGVVITFIDFTAQRQAQEAAHEADVFADTIVDTVREALIVLDANLQVVSANRSFYETFGDTPDETVGRPFLETGQGRWDVPALRELLEVTLPARRAFNDAEIEHIVPGLGRRTLLLNGRHLPHHDLFLLTTEDITRRKQTERQLLQERDLAQLYLDVAAVTMVALDRDGVVTLINQTGCRMLGYAEDEIVGQKWFDRFLPAHAREAVRQLFEGLLDERSDATRTFENPVCTRDGSERLILWHNALLRDDDGFVTGTLASGTDVTERRQREQALRESEQRFRNLFEATPDAIFVENLDGTVIDVNPAACRLHNIDRAALVGRHVRELVPPDLRDNASEAFQRLVAGEESYLQAYSWTVNGYAVPVEVRANRFVYDGQDAILLIVRDVSERIEAEQALEEMEAHAQAVLETTSDAVVTIDTDGQIVSLNPATERIFGYAATELIGRPVAVLMPAPHDGDHQRYLERYLETGERHVIGVGREVLARRKDGSTFPVDLAVSEVRVGGRRLFTGFMRDISDRRRLENQVLRISDEERQRVGRDLHDGLGSLLTGLAMGAQGLAQIRRRGDSVEPEALEHLAQMVEEGATQAQALARGLNPVKLDDEGLPAALQDLASTTRLLTGIACLFMTTEPLPALNNIVATQLYRIAQEALNNAVKHAAAQHVTVSLVVEDGDLVLRIRDDGTGLQGEPTPASGTGLYIMPYRANLIGAAYNIENAETGGTLITCRLPLDQAVPPHDA